MYCRPNNNGDADMTTETLFEIYTHDGLGMGIGNLDEIKSLCADGVLPPFETLTLKLIGTFAVSA